MFLSPIVDGHPRGMPRRRRVGIPIHRKKGFRVAEEQPLRPLPINAARNKSWKRGDSTWLERGHRPGFVNKTIREYRGGGGGRERKVVPFLKDFRRKKSREYPGEEARELITNFNGS